MSTSALADLLRMGAAIAARSVELPAPRAVTIRTAGGRARVVLPYRALPDAASWQRAADRVDGAEAQTAAIVAPYRARVFALAALPPYGTALAQLRDQVAKLDHMAACLPQAATTKEVRVTDPQAAAASGKKCKPEGTLFDRVVAAVAAHPDQRMRAGEVRVAVGSTDTVVRSYLTKAVKRGILVIPERGLYQLAAAEKGSPVADALPGADALPVRTAARLRMPLGGADAQALEGALAMTERERDAARAAQAGHQDDEVKTLRAQLALATRYGDELAGALRTVRDHFMELGLADPHSDENAVTYLHRLVPLVDKRITSLAGLAANQHRALEQANRALRRIRSTTDGVTEAGAPLNAASVADRVVEVADERWALQERAEVSEARGLRIAQLWAAERRRADGLERLLARRADLRPRPEPLGAACARAVTEVICNASCRALERIGDAFGIDDAGPDQVARAVVGHIKELDALVDAFVGPDTDPASAVALLRSVLERSQKRVDALESDMATERAAAAVYMEALRSSAADVAELRATQDAMLARRLVLLAREGKLDPKAVAQ